MIGNVLRERRDDALDGSPVRLGALRAAASKSLHGVCTKTAHTVNLASRACSQAAGI